MAGMVLGKKLASELTYTRCGHIWIQDHGCFQMLEATISRQEIEESGYSGYGGIKNWLSAKGFDIEREVEEDRNAFNGSTTYRQLVPVRCEAQGHNTQTLEGLREWMKAGCPS